MLSWGLRGLSPPLCGARRTSHEQRPAGTDCHSAPHRRHTDASHEQCKKERRPRATAKRSKACRESRTGSDDRPVLPDPIRASSRRPIPPLVRLDPVYAHGADPGVQPHSPMCPALVRTERSEWASIGESVPGPFQSGQESVRPCGICTGTGRRYALWPRWHAAHRRLSAVAFSIAYETAEP